MPHRKGKSSKPKEDDKVKQIDVKKSDSKTGGKGGDASKKKKGSETKATDDGQGDAK